VGGTCGTHGRAEGSVQDFSAKAQRKESLGRPRRRWEDGDKWILGRLAGGSVDWIRPAQDRDG
jgi:hypothetical protein